MDQYYSGRLGRKERKGKRNALYPDREDLGKSGKKTRKILTLNFRTFSVTNLGREEWTCLCQCHEDHGCLIVLCLTFILREKSGQDTRGRKKDEMMITMTNK